MRIWLIVALVACVFDVFGQKKRDIREVAELLEKAKVFVEYRKFRSQFEDMTIEAGKHLRLPDDHTRLQVAYSGIQQQYNAFLGYVKHDLSSLATIREMATQPDAFALRYLRQYDAVVAAYNTDYQPVYRFVTRPDRSTMPQGKAISPAMVILGVELFLEIVDLVRARRGHEDDGENFILATINAYFVRKLEMKPWDELGIAPPNGPAATKAKPEKVKNSKKNHLRQLDTPVSAPLFDALEGWLEFELATAKGATGKMAFDQKKSKNLGVETLKNKDNTLVAQQSTVNIPEFVSKEALPEGAQFQLRVKNTAGMYVLAQQSDGSIVFLYPYNNESLKGCNTALGTGKDIGVMPATPITGRDRAQVTVLPAPDCATTPPTQRYFTVQPPMPASKQEQFCVLLTRSEINTQQMSRQMNAAKGDLAEKLAVVLGGNVASGKQAGLAQEKGQFRFKAGAGVPVILPIIFSIKRS
jgi:hypothetical protein